jgi:arylformamidase
MAVTLAGGTVRDAALLDAGAPTPVLDRSERATFERAFAAPGVPEWDAAITRYRDATAAARTRLTPGVARYGARPHEALDIYAPEGAPEGGRAAPAMVFIHGGGWRGLSRNEAGFAAPAFVAAGVVYVALDVTPLPDVALAEQLNQARRAIKWLFAHVAAHGGDPARLALCGHGSGAHVAAMLAGTNWRVYGLPSDLIKAAVLVSGLYDLEPLQRAMHPDWLGLDRVAALRLSPIRCPPPPTCRVLVAHGGREGAAFARQSDAYALALRATGAVVETLVVPDEDHCSAIETLADPKSVLGAAALELCGDRR